jgi:hypothetical protein
MDLRKKLAIAFGAEVFCRTTVTIKKCFKIAKLRFELSLLGYATMLTLY